MNAATRTRTRPLLASPWLAAQLARRATRPAPPPPPRPAGARSYSDDRPSSRWAGEPVRFAPPHLKRENWGPKKRVRTLEEKRALVRKSIENNKAPSEEQLEERHKRRVQRAERLERMDITMQLRETKTCAFDRVLLVEVRHGSPFSRSAG